MRKSLDQRWFDKAVAAKVGTVPQVIEIDLRVKLEIGKRIWFRRSRNGKKENGKVVRVEPLMVSKI